MQRNYSALLISRDHCPPNNSWKTDIACMLGQGVAAFREFEVWSSFAFKVVVLCTISCCIVQWCIESRYYRLKIKLIPLKISLLGSCISLTHWGRVTHICVDNLTIIGPDNGLSPCWSQAIIWTNAGILVIVPWGTNLSKIILGIQTFSFNKMHLKMASVKWRPFCLGLNVLRRQGMSTEKLHDLYGRVYLYWGM